ncbi:MAG TPA: glycosyltransferase [Mucilaginibacter sp.]|nr:glycosyltransferase [Mucilaginibacter sp.]
MKIILRTCENFVPANDPRPDWCMEKDFKLKCFKSLADTLLGYQAELFIIGDYLTETTVKQYKRLYPGVKIINSNEKLGNSKSLLKVFELADLFTSDDIIYFCEDDYLYHPSFYKTITDFFETIGDEFEDVFFHPTDYPDQYKGARIRRSYIFNNKFNGWYREIDSTTFTFATRVKTFKKYSAFLKDCAEKNKVGYDRKAQPIFHPAGADDARFSEIFGFKNPIGYTSFHQSALCFCPMPGIASHMHTGTQSINFNWKDLYIKIEL